MLEILDDVAQFVEETGRACLARVVQVEGSGPRAPGAAMVVAADGRVAGSVSGGCVEGAVVEEATALLASGGSKLLRFGYSDDEAFAVGLTCGGIITIFLTPDIPDVLDVVRAAVRRGEPCALATVVAVADDEVAAQLEGRNAANACIVDARDLRDMTHVGATLCVRADGSTVGTVGDAALDELLARDGAGVVASGRSVVRHYGKKGEAVGDELSVFFEAFAPPPRMVIFGAVDFTGALVRVAKVLGYDVTVCDARAPFATTARFPEADRVVVEWPHRLLEEIGPTLGDRDAVCVLTHDPKFDVPALLAAVRTGVGYVGAMGSRRTHADRSVRLRDAGMSDGDLARVMAPIGLDIGARTPEETAVAILGEIISRQTGHGSLPLSAGVGPIHGQVRDAAGVAR